MQSLILEPEGVPTSVTDSPAPAKSVPADAWRVLQAARALLMQGEALLQALPAATYARSVSVAFGSSIGGHYRHCLDHFASLMNGRDTEFVDYDARTRDERLERDSEFALQRTRELRSALESLVPEDLDLGVGVRCQVSYEKGNSPITYSSLGREWVYAIAHGIHHYALIAVMARLQGAELPPQFGVAPSTVAHRLAQVGN